MKGGKRKVEMKKIVKLTGVPVSDEMCDILERLSKGMNVSNEEIENTKEMKLARSNVSPEIDTSMLKNREDLQFNIFCNLLKMGSAATDDNGKIHYDGAIRAEKRLDIVMGLPASGKSSAIVDKLSEEFHSRIIDNDEAKKMIPQYNDGWGAGAVHKESQDISDKVFLQAVFSGENIVLPKVGADSYKLIDHYIDVAKQNSYIVNVHFVDLDRNKALGRMLNRFIERGRFLDPNLIEKYAPLNSVNRIAQAYEELKANAFINGFSKWNNDVAKGEQPILLEYKNLTGKFIENARVESENYFYGKKEYYSTADSENYGRSRSGVCKGNGLCQGTHGRAEETFHSRNVENSYQSTKSMNGQENRIRKRRQKR